MQVLLIVLVLILLVLLVGSLIGWIAPFVSIPLAILLIVGAVWYYNQDAVADAGRRAADTAEEAADEARDAAEEAQDAAEEIVEDEPESRDDPEPTPTATPQDVEIIADGAQLGTYYTSAMGNPNEWSDWPSFTVPEGRLIFLRAVATRGNPAGENGVWHVWEQGETFNVQARDGAYTVEPADDAQAHFCAVWNEDVGQKGAAHAHVDTPWGSNPEEFC